MSKNIIVLSDGTGQEGGVGNNTNVYKLFNMVEDRTERQITFYDRGLGTGGRKLLGMATGLGISQNILECYEFIFNHFEAKDNIYLFGFSRGATTVRSLSAFIHMFGILPKSRPELIPKAYDIYRKRSGARRDRLAEEFVGRHHTMWARIKFLGVWDTVAALGVPFHAIAVLLDKIPAFRHKFHNLQLSEAVEHARQALAIDDERLTFHPQIWDEKIMPHQTMKQVWFCGMHTDVGGGYKQTELSDIALLWLIDEAERHGLRIYPDNKIEPHPDPDGFMHNSRGTFLTRLYRRRVRSWDMQRGLPVVHRSVKRRTRNRKNQEQPPYDPWILKLGHKVKPWERVSDMEEKLKEAFGKVLVATGLGAAANDLDALLPQNVWKVVPEAMHKDYPAKLLEATKAICTKAPYGWTVDELAPEIDDETTFGDLYNDWFTAIIWE